MAKSSTKTKSGARAIDLAKKTMMQLKKHCKQIKSEKEEMGESYKDHDLVVCTELCQQIATTFEEYLK